MVYLSTCCSALVAGLASRVLFPGSQGYNESLTSYFSAQEEAVHPSCIVKPLSTGDVSKSVATLTRSNCSFAVRSGGHAMWAGDANIADGVTIDMQGLDSICISNGSSVVSVGPGARWGSVYKALVPYGRIIAGGRVGTVGVGGLTLGGGLSSFSPRYGWTCDSVVNFEVVLANGVVINANESRNADLLHALRGGSNNFGVVTRIDFQAHEQGDLWGGVVQYDFDTIEQQLTAASNLASADPYDEYASLTLGLSYVSGAGRSISNTLHYTKAVENPDSFKPFTNIPHRNSTLRTAPISSFADEGQENNPSGYRSLLATTTIGTSLQVITAAFEVWNSSVSVFDQTAGFICQLLLEPYPQKAYQTAALGTNSLGLDAARGGLVVVGVGMAWTDEADDALANRVAQDIIDKISAQAEMLGESFNWRYLNYATNWQDVIGSYGPENVAKLRKVSKTYDPRGVFQYNVPGGFKLH